MSRRDRALEAKSDLRGQRYNREKRQGARTDLTSPQNGEKSTTGQRLAEPYQVSRDTMTAPGAGSAPRRMRISAAHVLRSTGLGAPRTVYTDANR
jgi:hypothetical protein